MTETNAVTPRVVEAVFIGRRHGSGAAIRLNSIVRLFLRVVMWFIHLRIVPYRVREIGMVQSLRFGKWIFGRPQLTFFAGGSLGNTFENDLMKLIFQATAIANLADNAASSPLTNLAVALHTADPGETGDQTTSESAYTSYARVSVARTSGGWTVTNNSVSPVASIDFPAGTGGSGTVTHASVGYTGGGATKILFSGTVTPNIVTGNGVTPKLTTASTFTID